MYDHFKKLVKQSERITFLGGAGVSTESGIPDFRSEQGLWKAKTKFGCSPEELVSHHFFMAHTEAFYEFFLQHMVFPDVQPNITHHALAGLERAGKLQAIVTQNIDGLHQAAGSRKVLELHGSVLRYFCMDCEKKYDLQYVLDPSHRRENSFIPRCEVCEGMLKPDVVLFEEPLNQEIMAGAIDAIRGTDLLIIGGTSLVVYPAAGLVNYFRGKHIILINKQETGYDAKADLVIRDMLGKVFGAIADEV